MGIQDHIFDVEAALEGKPEADCFDKIHTYLGELERELELYRQFYHSQQQLIAAVQDIEGKRKRK